MSVTQISVSRPGLFLGVSTCVFKYLSFESCIFKPTISLQYATAAKHWHLQAGQRKEASGEKRIDNARSRTRGYNCQAARCPCSALTCRPASAGWRFTTTFRGAPTRRFVTTTTTPSWAEQLDAVAGLMADGCYV